MVARVRCGLVIIARASRLGMGVGKFSRVQRGVGVFAMPDAALDATRRVESVCNVLPGGDVLRLLVPGVAVGVFIDRRSMADGLEVTR